MKTPEEIADELLAEAKAFGSTLDLFFADLSWQGPSLANLNMAFSGWDRSTLVRMISQFLSEGTEPIGYVACIKDGKRRGIKTLPLRECSEAAAIALQCLPSRLHLLRSSED